MSSWKVKFAVLLVIVGLLAACAAPATETPGSEPTEKVAPATQAATEAVTEAPAEAATEAATTEAPATEAAAAGTVSFASDILPILQSRCINCHGGQRTEEGLSLTSHAALLTGAEDGAVIIPGDGANSLLVQLVAEGRMPKRGPKLTPDQVQLIQTWINEGAHDN